MRFRKTPTFLTQAMGLAFALCAWAQQQRPLTQDQVQSLVRAGLGDDSGAKLIEQRRIDFAPTDDYPQSLKAAGASEAFLKVLRAAKPTGMGRHCALVTSENSRFQGVGNDVSHDRGKLEPAKDLMLLYIRA